MTRDERDKPTGSGFVSAQQVAARAGVSRSAVSRTFTQGASVAPATREKVLEAARDLGYHVNHLARGLIREKSNIVSLVVTDLDTPHQSRVVEALTRRLQEADKVAMVINTSGDDEGVASAVRQTLEYRADSTLMLSGQPPRSLIETCLSNGQRVILVNRSEPGAGPETVLVDNRRAASDAFDLLVRAGCRDLALVASKVESSSLVARTRAFVEAAEKAGLPVRVVRHGPTAYASGAEAARRLLSDEKRPDGVFCVTDLLACGFIDTARHAFGLQIPRDVSIVGFDDIEQAGWSSYRLTTFRQPVEAIANHVVALLDAPPPESGAQPDPVVFPAAIVMRDTVRPA